MDENIVEERITEDWAFRTFGAEEGIAVVDAFDVVPSYPVRLLQILNETNTLVAADSQHLVFVPLENLRSRLHSGGQLDTESDEVKRIELTGALLLEGLSNQSQVAVYCANSFLYLYSLSGEQLWAKKIPKITDIRARPATTDLAYVTPDGVFLITNAGTKPLGTGQLFGWNYHGDRFVTVKGMFVEVHSLPADGKLTLVESFALPSDLMPSHVQFVGEQVLYIEQAEDSEDPEYSVYIRRDDSWLLIPDACPPFGDTTRRPAWYVESLNNWLSAGETTFVAAAANSADILLGDGDFVIAPAEDSGRAMMPFVDGKDTSPIGSGFDYSSKIEVLKPLLGVDRGISLPIFWVLNDQGKVTAWSVVSRKALDSKAILSPAEVVSGQLRPPESLQDASASDTILESTSESSGKALPNSAVDPNSASSGIDDGLAETNPKTAAKTEDSNEDGVSPVAPKLDSVHSADHVQATAPPKVFAKQSLFGDIPSTFTSKSWAQNKDAESSFDSSRLGSPHKKVTESKPIGGAAPKAEASVSHSEDARKAGIATFAKASGFAGAAGGSNIFASNATATPAAEADSKSESVFSAFNKQKSSFLAQSQGSPFEGSAKRTLQDGGLRSEQSPQPSTGNFEENFSAITVGSDSSKEKPHNSLFGYGDKRIAPHDPIFEENSVESESANASNNDNDIEDASLTAFRNEPMTLSAKSADGSGLERPPTDDLGTEEEDLQSEYDSAEDSDYHSEQGLDEEDLEENISGDSEWRQEDDSYSDILNEEDDEDVFSGEHEGARSDEDEDGNEEEDPEWSRRATGVKGDLARQFLHTQEDFESAVQQEVQRRVREAEDIARTEEKKLAEEEDRRLEAERKVREEAQKAAELERKKVGEQVASTTALEVYNGLLPFKPSIPGDLGDLDEIFAETNSLFQLTDNNLKLLVTQVQEEKKTESKSSILSPDQWSVASADGLSATIGQLKDELPTKHDYTSAERSAKTVHSRLATLRQLVDDLGVELDAQLEEQSAEALRLRGLPYRASKQQKSLRQKFRTVSDQLAKAEEAGMLQESRAGHVPSAANIAVSIDILNEHLERVSQKISSVASNRRQRLNQLATAMASLDLEHIQVSEESFTQRRLKLQRNMSVGRMLALRSESEIKIL